METIRLTCAQAIITFLKNQYIDQEGLETPLVAGLMGIFGHGNVAGLGEALMDPNANLTVFAPTDDAFAALPTGQLEALLEDAEALTNLLQYHLHGMELNAEAVAQLDGMPLFMANGEDANISVSEDGIVMINDAEVVSADVVASNGVIHAIDKVLQPTGLDSVAFVDFSGTFDGTTVEDDVYTFPTAAAPWAGFANENTSIYPLSFPLGGQITFTGSIPEGGVDTSVYFRFERLPWPDVEPSYNTENVTVTVADGVATYTVDIPSQGANTFQSFLMYVVDRDQPVKVENVRVVAFEDD